MNTIFQDHYITIHVTPEPDFSYVSFETNQNVLNLNEQMLKVLEIFKCVLFKYYALEFA